jgi:hypothetical protein
LHRSVEMRSALFWSVTQRRVVIFYRRFGTTYLSQLQGPRSKLDFLTLEDGAHTLSQNVCKGLPFDAALYPRKAQTSSASRPKPEIIESVELFRPSENRIKAMVVVSMLMDMRVLQKRQGVCWQAERPLAPQEDQCSLKTVDLFSCSWNWEILPTNLSWCCWCNELAVTAQTGVQI